jgi:hypothetical protein
MVEETPNAIRIVGLQRVTARLTVLASIAATQADRDLANSPVIRASFSGPAQLDGGLRVDQ